MKKEYKITIIVGIFYLVYILLFIAKFAFNPSATIELSDRNVGPYIDRLPKGLVIQKDSDGYDGHYYYLIAIDLMQKEKTVNSVAYQRILYPFLAYIFSLGNIYFIPLSLLLINYFSIVFGTYILILILKKYSANLNLAYLWAFNVGFFICIIRDLTSPLMFLFVILSVYHLKENKFRISSFFLMLAILTGESAILIVIPLILYFLIKRKYKIMFTYSFSLVIFFIWQIAMVSIVGKAPIFGSTKYLAIPFQSLIKYISQLSFPNSLREFYLNFSLLPLILFIFIQLYIIVRSKKLILTPYLIILLFQLMFIIMPNFEIYTALIDALGRYTIGIFLFSILYSAEKKEKYNFLFVLLMTLMSVSYFIVKIIIFEVEYFIT